MGYRRDDFTASLGLTRRAGDGVDCAQTLFRRGWASKALGNLNEAAADFEAAKSMEPSNPHFYLDYRDIHDVELIDIDDGAPYLQRPLLLHD